MELRTFDIPFYCDCGDSQKEMDVMHISISLKCFCEGSVPAQDIKVTRVLGELEGN
jgi:hypothetical protein